MRKLSVCAAVAAASLSFVPSSGAQFRDVAVTGSRSSQVPYRTA